MINCRIAIAVALSTALSACSTSTRDIDAFDQSTFIASISTSKAIKDRAELDTELTLTAGSRNQLVDGYGVQINGYRPPTGEVLHNRHTLAAATTHYKYRLVDHDLFQLSLAAGAQLSYYTLRISSETVQNTLKQLDAGLGVKFETVINLNHHLQLVANTALYDSRSRDIFYKNSLFLQHTLKEDSMLYFGYQSQGFTDGVGSNGDNCEATETPNCTDSEIEIGSKGFLLGYRINR